MIREEDFYYQYDKEDCMMLIPREVFYELYEEAKELENIVEELKKWLKSNTDVVSSFIVVLDKIKELEKGK